MQNKVPTSVVKSAKISTILYLFSENIKNIDRVAIPDASKVSLRSVLI